MGLRIWHAADRRWYSCAYYPITASRAQSLVPEGFAGARRKPALRMRNARGGPARPIIAFRSVGRYRARTANLNGHRECSP